jgi:hypothetical protein
MSIASIPVMPPSIHSMDISIEPQSEESVNSPKSLLGSMARLPRGLTSLSLSRVEKAIKFSKSDFELLPHTLSFFSFELSDIKDFNTLLAIPAPLKYLSMQISGEIEKNLLFDVNLLNYLPSGLDSICIISDSIVFPWQQWMRVIPRFEDLKALFINFSRYTDEMEPVDLNFIHDLPRSVTELQLPMDRTELTPELMRGFPKKLQSLLFYSTPRPTSKLTATDSCFANVPKTLITLTLPIDLEGVTEEMLNVLPPFIATLNLPRSLHHLKSQYYAREPEWEQ